MERLEKRRNILLVTRRFWPLTGAVERSLATVTAQLALRGFSVRVATAWWHPSWPRLMHYGLAPVERVYQRPMGWFSSRRSIKRLVQHVRSVLDDVDVVLVSRVGEEAAAVVDAVAGQRPVVIRAEVAGPRGDCLGLLEASSGESIHRACACADLLLPTSRATERELIAAGYPRDRIEYTPPCVAPREPTVDSPLSVATDLVPADEILLQPDAVLEAARQADGQAADSLEHQRIIARAVLAQADRRLDVRRDEKIVLGLGGWTRTPDVDRLRAMFGPVLRRRENVRLWMLGEGPVTNRSIDRLVEIGYPQRVFALPIVETADDFLTAADVVVAPAEDRFSPAGLIEAMGSPAPIVALDNAPTRDLLEDERDAILVDPDTPEAMGRAVERLLDNEELAQRLSAAASEQAATEFDIQANSNQLADLLRTVMK